MKRIALYLGIAAAMVVSCSIQEEDFKAPVQDDVIFYASFEQPSEETRVYANEDLYLRWTADDRVSIFGKNTYNQQYKFLGETGDNAGGFNKVDVSEYVTGNPISHVVSVYPYQTGTKITEDEVITLTLPAEQHYAENTFGLGANTMVSVSENNFLQYKNVGGYLVLKLYGNGVSVSSITLKGNNGEKLAGKATVTMPLDGTPSVVMADDAITTVTLTCEKPVQLGLTEEESTQFWFVIPPVTFEEGFTVTVTNSAGESYVKSTTKSYSISRSTLSRMSALKVDFAPVASTLAEISGFADGTRVKTKPVQVMAKTMRGFILSDDTRTIFLYSTKDLDGIDVGDIIQVTSTFVHYRELPELSGIESVERISSGNTPTYPSPTDITERSDFEADFFKDFQYISLKGSLQSIRSNNAGVSYFVERSTEDTLLPFNIFYPSDYQDASGYSIGDLVRAEGYFAGFNSTDICIIITSMTVQHLPAAIDLGLPSGVKWASFNLGASAPEEYGDYFAWGDPEPYYSSQDPLTWKDGKEAGYIWSSYKWCMGSETTITKYCTNTPYESYGYNGFTDSKTVIDLEDDAASVNLGDKWRMPTIDEFDELRKKCSWEWTQVNGINGRKVTGPNGNSIFLPAADYRLGTYLCSGGFYWSSSLLLGLPDRAYCIGFGSGGVNWNGNPRYYGFTVRPVYGEFLSVESVSLNKTSLSLLAGSTEQLTVSISPSNATEKRVTWISSNTSVATVSDGVVTAVSAGAATITVWASDGVHFATCDLTVREQAPVPEAIDLGLPSGLKWASFNLGASKPEEYGDYYAWGEIEPYYSSLDPLTWKEGKETGYSWTSYKWCMGDFNMLTKYCTRSDRGYNGFTDGQTLLDPEDDVAHVNLGGNWRMPTDAEWTELMENCTWTWTTMNGKSGYKVTAHNDSFIFLPAAGYRNDNLLDYVGSAGLYWSSSLYTGAPDCAWFVDFSSDLIHVFYRGYRVYGISVRPVCD